MNDDPAPGYHPWNPAARPDTPSNVVPRHDTYNSTAHDRIGEDIATQPGVEVTPEAEGVASREENQAETPDEAAYGHQDAIANPQSRQQPNDYDFEGPTIEQDNQGLDVVSGTSDNLGIEEQDILSMPENSRELESQHSRTSSYGEEFFPNYNTAESFSYETAKQVYKRNGAESQTGDGAEVAAGLEDRSRGYEHQGAGGATLAEAVLDESPAQGLLNEQDIDAPTFGEGKDQEGSLDLPMGAALATQHENSADIGRPAQLQDSMGQNPLQDDFEWEPTGTDFATENTEHTRAVNELNEWATANGSAPAPKNEESALIPHEDLVINAQTISEAFGSPAKEDTEFFPSLGADIMNAALLDEGAALQGHEEDISAKWAAAFEDDGFLAEGEELDEDPDKVKVVDPSAFFLDDGEGFLEDGPEEPDESSEPVVQESAYGPEPQAIDNLSASYHSSEATQPIVQYANLPRDNSTRDFSYPYFARDGQTSYRPSSQRSSVKPLPPPLVKAESFVDKAKGGYTSPYDLPMEVNKPRERRRPGLMTPGPGTQPAAPPPPPRRSSSQAQQALLSPCSQPSGSHVPHISSSPMVGQATMPSHGTSPKSPQKPSSFFEELPTIPKPRTAPTTGRYTPQPVTSPSMYQQPPPPHPRMTRPSAIADQSASSAPGVATQLRPPERVGPYQTDGSTSSSTQQLRSQGPSRYSPAPAPPSAPLSAPQTWAQYGALPPPAARYSPAVPASAPSAPHGRYASAPAGPQTVVAQAFAPRTSSPLLTTPDPA